MARQHSFDDFALRSCPDFPIRHPPSIFARIIGSSCGAFVLCFLSILFSLPFLKGVDDQEVATLFWMGSLFCGAIGGFSFPRVSHFLAYAFILFINIMLVLMIGRNIGEQMTLFCAFALSEMIFFMSRDVMRKP